jgi:hypothetical protein
VPWRAAPFPEFWSLLESSETAGLYTDDVSCLVPVADLVARSGMLAKPAAVAAAVVHAVTSSHPRPRYDTLLIIGGLHSWSWSLLTQCLSSRVNFLPK